MTLQWGRRRDVRDDCEATRALERAKSARIEVDKKWPRVSEVAATLGRLRTKNHFIDGFRRTL